jgi:FeS assembly SUF system protein
MNLFKAFSSKPEPQAEPDAPIDTSALMKPAPPVPPPPIEMVNGKPVYTEPATPALAAIRDEVVKTLKTCFDPEIPVNIYELGLIYDIVAKPLTEDTAEVVVRMTLTSPNCPAAVTLPGEVQFKAGQVAGVTSAKVDLVWEPSWNPNLMSEAAKLQLGML